MNDKKIIERWYKNMNKNYGIVEDEVRLAYYDVWNENVPFEIAKNIRNLSFRASKAVGRDNAIKILEKYVNSYNEFKPELLKSLPESVMIVIAREGSMCLYVLSAKQLTNTVNADEFHEEKKNVYRFWWD